MVKSKLCVYQIYRAVEDTGLVGQYPISSVRRVHEEARSQKV
jgi:hypothetical protein